RDIGGPAEKERMAEREETAVTDQQVERAGEQRKAQRLHQEDRVDREGRDRERDDQNRERDPNAAIALAVRSRRRHRIDHALHHALRPNSPLGRMSRTIAMMTKITVFDASG